MKPKAVPVCDDVAPELRPTDFAPESTPVSEPISVPVNAPLEDQIPGGFVIFEKREWDEKREVVHDAFFSGTMLLMLVISEIRKYREKDILEDYLTYLIHSIMDPFFDHKKEAELHERLAKSLRTSAARAEANLGTEK